MISRLHGEYSTGFGAKLAAAGTEGTGGFDPYFGQAAKVVCLWPDRI